MNSIQFFPAAAGRSCPLSIVHRLSHMKSAEAVTEGHPDKVCDQIADAILDAYLFRDPSARVAVEVFGSHGLLVIGGEVTSEAQVDVESVARKVYANIGYPPDIEILANIHKQSPEISAGVNLGGAGDQGIMHGYATSETKEMMPRAFVLSQKLAQGLADLRRHDPEFSWIKPDGKTQVTMDAGRITNIVVSTQHEPTIATPAMRPLLIASLIKPIVGEIAEENILINPSGSFLSGGFGADTGLTGRKIMVDSYGPLIPHGGGAFSGKDATKVDRSAAYMCRFAAKNLVTNGLAKNCMVSVAYAIGQEAPVMLSARGGDGKDLTEVLKKHFDFRPLAIIERLKLRQPIFERTACYGHFGREGFPWEDVVKL
jgi:S-adenosylmethionine synthetase